MPRSKTSSSRKPTLQRTLRDVQRRQRATLAEVELLLASAHEAGEDDALLDGQLAELEEQSREIAEGLRTLAGQLVPGSSRRGRPRREDSVAESDVRAAPFAELVRLPAQDLRAFIRAYGDRGKLRAAHAFECAHDRRVSVLEAVEGRLRRLGDPLGGPAVPPWPDVDDVGADVLVGRLQGRAGQDRAATAYAWEFYRQRRRAVLDAAAAKAGLERCQRAVRDTSPRPPAPAEPFAGYGQLTSSSAMRGEVRRVLFSQDAQALRRAKEFELATRRRAGLLKIIDRALADAERHGR